MACDQVNGVRDAGNPAALFDLHDALLEDPLPAARTDGLLLTPTIDHLFDRGFIGFEGNGNLIVAPVAHKPSLERMGIDTTGTVNVGGFTAGQREFLDFHRDKVLLKSAR